MVRQMFAKHPVVGVSGVLVQIQSLTPNKFLSCKCILIYYINHVIGGIKLPEYNTKTTKADLIEMLKRKDKEIAELNAGRYDPAKEKEEHRIKSAKQTVKDLKENPGATKESMFSMVENVMDAIKEKMNISSDLDVAIAEKQRELQELHGFESEYLHTAALIAAKEEMIRKYDEQIANKKSEVAMVEQECKDAIAMARQAAEKQAKQINADIQTERAREESEYQYNLKRSRQIENDAWADEKASREKELAEREEDLVSREIELDSRESDLNAREGKLEEIQSQMDEIKAERDSAIEKGKEIGREMAEKEKDAQIKAINAENSYKYSLLESELKSANATITDLHERINDLTDMLNAATEKNQELAKEVVAAMSIKAPVYHTNTTEK